MPILPKQAVLQISPWPTPYQGRANKIRLDSGEHPEGFGSYYPFDLDSTLISIYPEYGALLRKLAKLFNVQPQNILLSNGSDNGLALIAQTFIEPNSDRAVCNSPSFVVIPHSLQVSGARVTAIRVRMDLSCDVDAVRSELEQHLVKLVMVASPDNPTGMMVAAETIEKWCTDFPETLFVVDEAYYEFTQETVLHMVSRFDNLIVTRTFSKAWGMAGLRLGVLIGNEQLISYMARVRPLFDVNSVAVETAIKMADHKQEVTAAAQDIMKWKAKLVTQLTAAGFNVHQGSANFFLLNMGEYSIEFAETCAKENILVRVCAPTADPANLLYGKIRVSIGTPEQNEKFIAVAKRFAAKQLA